MRIYTYSGLTLILSFVLADLLFHRNSMNFVGCTVQWHNKDTFNVFCTFFFSLFVVSSLPSATPFPTYYCLMGKQIIKKRRGKKSQILFHLNWHLLSNIWSRYKDVAPKKRSNYNLLKCYFELIKTQKKSTNVKINHSRNSFAIACNDG